jgi:hypothetical protein
LAALVLVAIHILWPKLGVDVAMAREYAKEAEGARGVRGLMLLLSTKVLIRSDEFISLEELIDLLNRAVHGADVDPRASEWAIDYGSRIIKTLEMRAAKPETSEAPNPTLALGPPELEGLEKRQKVLEVELAEIKEKKKEIICRKV